MVTARLEKRGDEYLVTLPADEVERLGLVVGEAISVDVRRADDGPLLSPDLQAAYETEFKLGEAALRYLAR